MRPDIVIESDESTTHSFIVRIWHERTGSRSGRLVWRGHITHVTGGERRYLHRLDDILDFIIPYLTDTDRSLWWRWRIWRWLRRRL